MAVYSDSRLAIHGGPRAVPEEVQFRIWPEITCEDEELVLASLRYHRRMQVADLDYIASSVAAQTTIAEKYVGLPL